MFVRKWKRAAPPSKHLYTYLNLTEKAFVSTKKKNCFTLIDNLFQCNSNYAQFRKHLKWLIAISFCHLGNFLAMYGIEKLILDVFDCTFRCLIVHRNISIFNNSNKSFFGSVCTILRLSKMVQFSVEHLSIAAVCFESKYNRKLQCVVRCAFLGGWHHIQH